MSESAAIDVEHFEYPNELLTTNAEIVSPAYDVEIFLSGFDAIENSIKKKWVTVEGVLQEAKIALVQFHPESFAFQVLQPAGAEVAPPVFLHPAAFSDFAQVSPRLFARNPLVTLNFLFAIGVDA